MAGGNKDQKQRAIYGAKNNSGIEIGGFTAKFKIRDGSKEGGKGST